MVFEIEWNPRGHLENLDSKSGSVGQDTTGGVSLPVERVDGCCALRSRRQP